MNSLMKTSFLLKGMFPYFGSIILHGSLIGAFIFQGEYEKRSDYQPPYPSVPVILLSTPVSEKEESLQEEKPSPRPAQKFQEPVRVTKDTYPLKKETITEKKLQKPANLETVSSAQYEQGTQSSLKKTKGVSPSADSFEEEDRWKTNSSVNLLRPVYAPKPSYPLIARRKKWEGKASVRLFVDQDGRVYEAHLVSSSSHEILDQAALKGLKEWRFPRVCQSCDLRSYTVPVSFFLKDCA